MAEKVMHSAEGKFVGSARANPWMISTFVLIAVLAGFVVFSQVGGPSANVADEKSVADDVVKYLNGRVGGSGSDVVFKDIKLEDSGLYLLTVDYKGQAVPVYVTANGKNLVSDVIPLADAPAGLTGDAIADVPTSAPVEVIANGPSKGDADAPVTVVEFSDYQCPFCERGYRVVGQIEEKYISSGKVRFVFMDFPLSFHPEAQPAAEAARCFGEQNAGDEDYFKFHDKLFENQASLSVANYKKWARELGANSAKFDKCLDDGKYAQAVQDDLAYGQTIGVSGTPAFFVNGKLISGAQPFSVFEQAIEAELAKSA